jgi:hypothetical protein
MSIAFQDTSDFANSPCRHANTNNIRDSKADILWRNRITGEVRLWTMDGASVAQTTVVGTQSLDFEAVGVLNTWNSTTASSGNPAIVWRNSSTGAIQVWQMDGVGNISNIANLGTAPTGANTAANSTLADLNGDGNTDIVYRSAVAGTGDVTFWTLASNTAHLRACKRSGFARRRALLAKTPGSSLAPTGTWPVPATSVARPTSPDPPRRLQAARIRLRPAARRRNWSRGPHPAWSGETADQRKCAVPCASGTSTPGAPASPLWMPR